MQVANEQVSCQPSEAPHHFTMPGSTLGSVMADYQPGFQSSPINAASQRSPWQAQQQQCFSNLQGGAGPGFKAAAARPLDPEPHKGLFPASAPAPQPECTTAPWQPTPHVFATPPQPPSQPTQSRADCHLHSFGHQPLPAQPVPAPSLQHPTALLQQGHLPCGQWVHPAGRRGMTRTGGQAHVPQSSLPASMDPAQPGRGASSGSARDSMHTPRPDANHSSGPWGVTPHLQLQPQATPMPVCLSTAAHATPSWLGSYPRPESLPLRHPVQASHPTPHSDLPLSPSSQPQGPLHQAPHGTQQPHPSLPPRPPTQASHPNPPASHPFPGQGSFTVPSSRPYSRCDHPSYAHLDLLRPLCFQQPPNCGHPLASESYSASSHVAEDPLCFQRSPVPGYHGSWESHSQSVSPFVACDRPSLPQQQPRSALADVHHLLPQQLHDGSQQGRRHSGLTDLQAQQQGQGLGSALAGCHPEHPRRQIQPPASTVDPATCNGVWPQSSWAPMGMLLAATLELRAHTK